MIRHSNSFIFSIIIHMIIFIGLFFSYKHITAGLQEQKEEPLLCIQLSTRCTPVVSKLSPQINKSLNKVKDKKVKVKRKEVKQKTSKKKVYTKEVIAVNKVVIVEKVFEKKSPSENKATVNVIKKKKVTLKINKITKAKITPQQEYIDENIKKIIALLQENLHYPRRARKRGIQGEVLVRFTLSLNAQISNIEVLSSYSEVLSRGAIQTIKNINKKLPKPKQNITFNVPISYTLH
ncbi:energy transducer TonB [Sulfurimonas sp. SAG-AH-194-C21]|nr:energy transducer TonB [Sulfurimonas sp. SAG-AH-194-C21]MDF1882913.1 energy transducer TonB [Sulfurimonas sp. SAG-AH-194-C21]